MMLKEKQVEEDDLEEDVEDEVTETDPTGRYVRGTILGRGAFKTVYRAFDGEEGMEVAWNEVNIARMSEEEKSKLKSEVELLAALTHPRIIEFYDCWLDEKSQRFVFVTECMTSGTLREYIGKNKQLRLKIMKRWCSQILEALQYLHTRDPPIIHRDVKCDNIFINGNHGTVKIGDLGLSTIMVGNHAQSVIGTPEFMAPELYDEFYTELVDVYAFGMCMLEMVTLEYPFSECDNAAQIYKKVVSGARPASLQRVATPSVRAFIELCLAPKDERLSSTELLQHEFLVVQESDNKTNVLVPPARKKTGKGPSTNGLDFASQITEFQQIHRVSRADVSGSDPNLRMRSTSSDDRTSDSSATAKSTPVGVAMPINPAVQPMAKEVSPPGPVVSSSGALPDGQNSNPSQLVVPDSERRAEEPDVEKKSPKETSEEREKSVVDPSRQKVEAGGSATEVEQPPDAPVREEQPAEWISPVLDATPREDSRDVVVTVTDPRPTGSVVDLVLTFPMKVGPEDDVVMKEVEFSFDLREDTPTIVAQEMVQQLELHPEQEIVIRDCLQDQIFSIQSRPGTPVSDREGQQERSNLYGKRSDDSSSRIVGPVSDVVPFSLDDHADHVDAEVVAGLPPPTIDESSPRLVDPPPYGVAVAGQPSSSFDLHNGNGLINVPPPSYEAKEGAKDDAKPEVVSITLPAPEVEMLSESGGAVSMRWNLNGVDEGVDSPRTEGSERSAALSQISLPSAPISPRRHSDHPPEGTSAAKHGKLEKAGGSKVNGTRFRPSGSQRSPPKAEKVFRGHVPHTLIPVPDMDEEQSIFWDQFASLEDGDGFDELVGRHATDTDERASRPSSAGSTASVHSVRVPGCRSRRGTSSDRVEAIESYFDSRFGRGSPGSVSDGTSEPDSSLVHFSGIVPPQITASQTSPPISTASSTVSTPQSLLDCDFSSSRKASTEDGSDAPVEPRGHLERNDRAISFGMMSSKYLDGFDMDSKQK